MLLSVVHAHKTDEDGAPLWQYYPDRFEDALVLPHVVGATPQSQDIRETLLRAIGTLCSWLELDVPLQGGRRSGRSYHAVKEAFADTLIVRSAGLRMV